MTASIERRDAALPTDQTIEPRRPYWLMRGVQIFTGAAALAGVSCLTFAWCLDHMRAAVLGATLIILAGISGAVWIADVLIADREEFYTRGQLDGWLRGWRGQEPTADDPFLR